MDQDTLFDQLTTMTKAYSYDIISQKCQELENENRLLRERVKALENLIDEYSKKMTEKVTTMQNILK